MNLNILESFKKISGYDIELFFESYYSFVQNQYPLIVNYYNGGDFDNLKEEVKKIEALIDQYSNNFNTTEFWDLNETISDIQTSLFTIDNLSRWLRSSRLGRFSSNLKVDYTQKQNQSLESISNNFGFDGQDDWADVAVQNQIIEEDYTNKGGKLLNAYFPNNNSFDLENIVDNLSQENLYGPNRVMTLDSGVP